MGRPPRWNKSVPISDGVLSFRLSRWRYFTDFVIDQLHEFPAYIYRGQADPVWPLESTLDRTLRRRGRVADLMLRQEHYERFRLAIRGRRGVNPQTIGTSDEMWALGQHYGLATPLLDWTRSPYVAAYFAFVDLHYRNLVSRSVFALNTSAVAAKSLAIGEAFTGAGRPPVLDVIEPMLDENARLVSQGGLFTHGPDGMSIEQWVRSNFPGETAAVLIRIDVPERERDACLRTLNRMNINHLSLFPELYGSSRFCNFNLEIDDY